MHQGKTKKKKKKNATKAQVCVYRLYTGKREDDEDRGKKKIGKGISRAINQCPILMVPSVGPDDIEPLSAPVQQRLYRL